MISVDIFYDSKLKFYCRIKDIVRISNKILGFIRRNCADFDDTRIFNKSFYVSYILNIPYPESRILGSPHFNASFPRKTWSASFTIESILVWAFHRKYWLSWFPKSFLLSYPYSKHPIYKYMLSKHTKIIHYAINTPPSHIRIMKTIMNLK